MPLTWTRVVVVVVGGLLLVARPMTPWQTVAAPAVAVDKLLTDASAAQDRATKAYADTLTKVNATKSMPNMDENEKTIVAALQQMAETLKTLSDANKATLDALKELRQMPK